MIGDMETPGARFNWFITENYGGIPQYAERFRFNKSGIYRIIKGLTSPKLETCGEYARTGINIHWLETGIGPWWSPDEIGRELAERKGIMLSRDNPSEAHLLDYTKLVRTIFTIAEESVIEKLAGNLLPSSPPSVKEFGGRKDL